MKKVLLFSLLILTSFLIGCNQTSDKCYNLPYEEQGSCYLMGDVKDPKECASLKNELGKDVCLHTSALETKNVKVCDKIEDEGRKNLCIVEFTRFGDYSVCERITGDVEKDYCYSTAIYDKFTYSESDAEICKKMKTQIGKDDCYLQLSYKGNTRKFCSLINDYTKKQECLHTLR